MSTTSIPQKVLIIMLATAALQGCDDRLNKTDLYGSYSFKLDAIEQVIALHDHGRYSNTLLVDAQIKWHYEAKWDFNSDGRKEIEFAEFKFGIPAHVAGTYGSDSGGFWDVDPERSIFTGEALLCFDPDDGYRCFRKIAGSGSR